ncbi:MAG: VOC family protein [Oscillospiraceae bacterium]
MKASNFVTGIQHIGLPTNDMSKTAEFYESLGFEKTYETMDGATKVCFFKLMDIAFEAYENGCAVNSYGAIDHISLNVTDVEKTFEVVSNGGYKVVSNGIEFLPFFKNGVKFFTIEGPNMEKIEFNQYM